MNPRKLQKEVFSVPNLMSYLRLLLIPVFCWLYLSAQTRQDYLWAAVVVLISSLTDMLDGWVARTFHQITDLGKVLDPVADKLTHAALAVCLAIRHPLMWVLCGLMVVKESYMAVMGIRFLRRGQMLDGARWCGKVSTAVLFIGLFVLFLFPNLSSGLVNVMILVMMGFLGYAFWRYAVIYRQLERGENDGGIKEL